LFDYNSFIYKNTGEIMDLKEHILKIISNKIKMAILAKFLSIEQYSSDILNDFSEIQRKSANNLSMKNILFIMKSPL